MLAGDEKCPPSIVALCLCSASLVLQMHTDTHTLSLTHTHTLIPTHTQMHKLKQAGIVSVLANARCMAESEAVIHPHIYILYNKDLKMSVLQPKSSRMQREEKKKCRNKRVGCCRRATVLLSKRAPFVARSHLYCHLHLGNMPGHTC